MGKGLVGILVLWVNIHPIAFQQEMPIPDIRKELKTSYKTELHSATVRTNIGDFLQNRVASMFISSETWANNK